MMKLPNKMTTEELAEFLGVARQTVNRWIRQQGWSTEPLPGVKGGRARLIHLTKEVRSFIMKTPSMRHPNSPYSIAEPAPVYVSGNNALHEIIKVLQNMTAEEQKQLSTLLAREGISGLLSRLGIEKTLAE
ncbi:MULTISPECIES: YfeC-like transcriptional regulator [Kosakonia]|uniref:Putative DNA-binding transcriptional regulator n=1 Tax=Kosakonia quasisacchari TaxID=2529380 RepID=A0A4V2M127_9ENTR|nr:YfeC-like transcriptional regulator [Kosakonia quasisacchari]TCC14376.1 putative DNA-binding transcriptional regulator [Kosakonia quasisacchari]